MSVPFRRWLRERISSLDTVKICTAERPPKPDEFGYSRPSHVIHTWSSQFIHVYLLDEMVKPKVLKKLIGENTRVGIGTVIVINAALVPEDGERLIPDEMLVTLHALFKDKIYTYRVEDGVPKLGQVHLKSYGRGDEREVWYGPDLDIKTLPCYRTWIKQPNSIKGEWLIANFGTEAFWKSADYTAGRSAFRQQQRQGHTHHAAWSNAGWGEFGGGGGQTEHHNGTAARPSNGAITRLDRSYIQLGLTRGASYDEVKAAFRKLARELHPDVSQLPKAEAEHRFKVINEAYIYIKTTNGW